MKLLRLKRWFRDNLGLSSMVSAFTGVVTGLCLLLLTPGKTIELWKFGVYIITSIFIIWSLLLALLSKNITSEALNIEVIKFCSSRNSELKCLLNICEYLTYGAYITLFENREGIEEYIATGKVENIQGNGIITVKIITRLDSNVYTKLVSNNVDVISAIIAKPIVTEEFLSIGGIENV